MTMASTCRNEQKLRRLRRSLLRLRSLAVDSTRFRVQLFGRERDGIDLALQK
jgi:hypothetical protein